MREDKLVEFVEFVAKKLRAQAVICTSPNS